MPISSQQLSPEHPLGKGEVVSSILTGSTSEAHKIEACDTTENYSLGSYRQNETRNSQLRTK